MLTRLEFNGAKITKSKNEYFKFRAFKVRRFQKIGAINTFETASTTLYDAPSTYCTDTVR